MCSPRPQVPPDPSDPRRRMAAQHRRSMPGGPGAGGYGGGGGSVSSYVSTIAELRTSVALHAHIKRGKAEAREVGGLQRECRAVPYGANSLRTCYMSCALAVFGMGVSPPERRGCSPLSRYSASRVLLCEALVPHHP